ncbi:hypothetical protein [Bradyrhizobium canariense]|nr:hypothetical protein [Bradyrhizobium canariense]OSI65454.1 hypothetical protein BSZ22_31665 [Bradyrhizobium canariense]OSI75764.1 hypothetical protein BSZ23_26975 [Bradyrhizobium canariense]
MAVVFLAKGKDEFKGLWQPNVQLQVEYKGVVNEVLDSSRRPEELRRQIIDGVNRGAALLQRTDPTDAKKQIEGANQTADELLKVMAEENEKRSERTHAAVILLATPPIALLIVGVTIAWIASGFRKSA